MNLPRGVCDTCGAPATKIVRDVFTSITGERYLKDEWRRGCVDHPVETRTFDADGKEMFKVVTGGIDANGATWVAGAER